MSENRNIILTVVVLVVLCCCCSALVLAYFFGDAVLDFLNIDISPIF